MKPGYTFCVAVLLMAATRLAFAADCQPKTQELTLARNCSRYDRLGATKYVGSWDNPTSGPNYCYQTLVTKDADGSYKVMRETGGNLRIQRYRPEDGSRTLRLKGETAECFVYDDNNSSYCTTWTFQTKTLPLVLSLDGADGVLPVAPDKEIALEKSKELSPLGGQIRYEVEKQNLANDTYTKLAAYADQIKAAGGRITEEEGLAFLKCYRYLTNYAVHVDASASMPLQPKISELSQQLQQKYHLKEGESNKTGR